jgi:hypothetical protein
MRKEGVEMQRPPKLVSIWSIWGSGSLAVAKFSCIERMEVTTAGEVIVILQMTVVVKL